MPSFRLLLPLLALLLTACYEVREPLLQTGQRVEGAKDGVWKRRDGSEITLHWNPALTAYEVASGGEVRLQSLGSLFMADYGADRRIVMLVAIQDGEIVLFQPDSSNENRLLAAHGLTLKPGPINRISGNSAALAAYFKDVASLAGSSRLQEVDRLVWVRP